MGCSPSKETSIKRNSSSSPLSDAQLSERIESPKQTQALKLGGYNMQFAWLSQRGYYPDSPNKENQDAYSVLPNFGGVNDHAFFAVYDGHGRDGHLCARFARDQLPSTILEGLKKSGTRSGEIVPHSSSGIAHSKSAISQAYLSTNKSLRANPKIDDSLSGTTAVSVLFIGSTMYISNVGDSRAIVISANDEGRIVAKPLSSDQTPYRPDERERCKHSGARILSMDQLEGLEPVHENWGNLNLGEDIDEGGDPPRIWLSDADYPGCAFTRSIGDSIAEKVGVTAEPEILERVIHEEDMYVVIASDGIFEFMTNQMVADMVYSRSDPLEACRAVVTEAYSLWLQYEVRTDDITIIVIKIEHASQSAKLRASIKRTVEDKEDILINDSKPIRRDFSRERKNMIHADTSIDNGAPDSSEDNNIDMSALFMPKTDEESRNILAAIRDNFLFQHLSSTQKEEVVGVMQRVVVKKGDWVINQGDKGDRFYIVDSGRFEVRVRSSPSDSTGGNVVHVYDGGNGHHPCFGELSLMYGKPRAASVISLGDGLLWALDRRIFQRVVLRTMSARRDILRNIRRVELLKCLSLPQSQRLADLMVEDSFAKDSYIIKQGEHGDKFYLIIGGLCECTINQPDGSEKTVLQLKEHDYFGERALLTAAPRAANVIARSPVKVLYVGKAAFEEVLGPLSDIIDADRNRREREAADLLSKNGPKDISEITFQSTILSDSLCILSLGKFSFSPSQTSYSKPNITIKSITLSEVDKHSLRTCVLADIAATKLISTNSENVSSPFLPKLISFIRLSNSLHLVFDTPVVADLTVITKAANTENFSSLSTSALVYVAACISSALDALHRVSIIYRAVQPSNVFIDASGRVILMDYRFAKVGGVGNKSYTICGAADYLAPEQISMQGHGMEVDLWSFGVTMYELAVGEHPFTSANEVATFSKITSFGSASFPSLNIPLSINANLRNFIQTLIVPNPDKRLGALGSGSIVDCGSALKSHKMFEDTKWQKISEPSYLSPLLSVAASEAAAAAASAVSDSALNADVKAAWEAPYVSFSGDGWETEIQA